MSIIILALGDKIIGQCSYIPRLITIVIASVTSHECIILGGVQYCYASCLMSMICTVHNLLCNGVMGKPG